MMKLAITAGLLIGASIYTCQQAWAADATITCSLKLFSEKKAYKLEPSGRKVGEFIVSGDDIEEPYIATRYKSDDNTTAYVVFGTSGSIVVEFLKVRSDGKAVWGSHTGTCK
jgi:hypothetical protein